MKGKFIVVEGLDGSGKSTQIELLKAHYDALGIPQRYVHFPMLNKGVYGELIAEFLRGEFGSLEQVHPKLVALLFANDRMEHIKTINRWLKKGYAVLADRYVNSNIAYQCAKTADPAERVALKEWILNFEYNINKLPRPDASFFLDVPMKSVFHALANQRDGEDRAYLKGKTDIHEASSDLQRLVYAQYSEMVVEQDDFHQIICKDASGAFLPPDVISGMIMERIEGVV